MATTWDPASVTAVTLSGNNLVATNIGTTSTDQGARGSVSLTSGKYYFEMTLTTITGGANRTIGVATPASSYTNISTLSQFGTFLVPVSGNIWVSGSGNSGTTMGARSAGDVIGIAVDFASSKMWFRVAPAGLWDNNGSHDPTTPASGGMTIPGGAILPVCTFGGSGGAAGNVVTANFGASAFVGAVPTGFTSWITAALPSPPPGTTGYGGYAGSTDRQARDLRDYAQRLRARAAARKRQQEQEA